MQGFNMGRYVPPDQEGVMSGNALHRKHALGSRAAKLGSQGILVVRFEMPFAVWCDHCPQPTIIGQGVRFNAEKKRVGHYHSSPIYSFRIRHTACGGELEIRTDPQHTRYVVVEGGRVRDTGDDKDDSLIKTGAEFSILTQRERQDLRESAFGKLEKTIEDREKLEDARQRIGELQDAATRQWDDPYAQNQRLRRAFRVGRHERETEAVRTEELRDRMSLGIDLLPGAEEDARRAALVDFGSVEEREVGSEEVSGFSETVVKRDKALAKPLFDNTPSGGVKFSTSKPESQNSTPRPYHHKSSSSKPRPSALKSEIAASRMRGNLVSEIVGNIRAAKDPFLDFDFSTSRSREKDRESPGLPGLIKKRKRTAAMAELDHGSDTPTTTPGERSGDGAEESPAPIPSVDGSPRPPQLMEKEKQGEGVLSAGRSAGTPVTGGGNTSLVAYDSDSD